MSILERPEDKRQSPTPAPRSARRTGRSGTGADSAMKQMREWEQRRAREVAQPTRDKPSLD